MANNKDNYAANKNKLLQYFTKTQKIAQLCGHKTALQELQQEAKHLQNEEFCVVICGECKRGKSSLINALLDVPNLCPVDATVATNNITLIRYGSQERINVCFRAEATQPPQSRQFTREELQQLMLGQLKGIKVTSIERIEVTLPNDFLKNGLVLVDTPGVGGLNMYHTSVTVSVLPMADAVIFVSKATDPLTDKELEFCHKNVRTNAAFMHVLTCRDQEINYAQRLADNQERFAQLFKVSPDNISAIAISSKYKLQYLTSGNAALYERSGFDALESTIWDCLENKTDILLRRAVQNLASLISTLRLPLEAAQTAASGDLEKVKEFAARLNAVNNKLQSLSSEQAKWQTMLSKQIEAAKQDAQQDIVSTFSSLQNEMDRLIKEKTYYTSPASLVDKMTEKYNAACVDILYKAEVQIMKIVERIQQEDELQINFEGFNLPSTIGADKQNLSTKLTSSNIMDKLSTFGFAFTRTSGGIIAGGTVLSWIVGALVGGFTGTFINPGVGTIAGAYAGIYAGSQVAFYVFGLLAPAYGVYKGVSITKSKDQDDLIKQCRSEVTKCIKNQLQPALQKAVWETFDKAKVDIKIALKQAITNLQANLKMAKQSLENAQPGQTEALNNANALQELTTMSNQAASLLN